MNLPIDEIIENGIAFNLFGDTPMDNIRIDELRRILREERERRRFT